jgi:hypothetical protein
MKCLSRTEIQEFLDKEPEPSQMARISDHIEKCERCKALYLQAVADRAMLNSFLDHEKSDIDDLPIPEFRYPESSRKKTLFLSGIMLLAAAIFTGFILLLHYEKRPKSEKIPEAEILMQEFYDGKDLNKMWHDKSQIFILEDEKGNVIESIITY